MITVALCATLICTQAEPPEGCSTPIAAGVERDPLLVSAATMPVDVFELRTISSCAALPASMSSAFVRARAGRVTLFAVAETEGADERAAADPSAHPMPMAIFTRAFALSACGGTPSTRETETEAEDAGSTAAEVQVRAGPMVISPRARAGHDESGFVPWWKRASTSYPITEVDAITDPLPLDEIAQTTEQSTASEPSWFDVIGREANWRAAMVAHERAAATLSAVEVHLALADASSRVALAPLEDESPALGAPLSRVVAWIELTDAQQVALRINGEIEQADLLRADLIAYFRSIKAYSLCALAEERIPIGAHEPYSLTMHASWESDAWPLVDALIEAERRLRDSKERFASLAERAGDKAGFPREAVDWLRNRLDLVARNLPANFDWSREFEEAVEAHMNEAFQQGAMFDGIARAPAFDRTDVLICRIYAQTVAFEVFGYAWSRANALAPSQQAVRARAIEGVLQPIRDAADSNQFAVAGVDPADTALGFALDHYARETARWKPWIVFPPTRDLNEGERSSMEQIVTMVSASIMRDIARRSNNLREQVGRIPTCTPRDRTCPSDVNWQIDGGFAVDASPVRPIGRPWIMQDCAMLFWDGYVALRRW